MSLTKTKEFITALGIAYKQAGNNAYFGNGFYEGVVWAEQNPVDSMVRQGDQPVQNAGVVSCNNCGSIKKVSDRFKDAIIFNNCYCTVYITACAECGTIINEETWVE